MNGLDNLRAAVRKYSENYRKDGLPPFEISKLYNIERDWANSNPLSDRAGCYAFFDEEFNLSYIGKASNLSSLGARIGSYFIRSGSSNFAKFRHKWKKLPRHIISIAVAEPFEAPSLEEFLIHNLKPSENLIGV